MVGNPLQAMGVEHDARNGLLARTERTDTAAGGRGDQVGVVYPGLTDVRVVRLHTQTAEKSGQEVEKGLRPELETLDIPPILQVDRTQDFRVLGRAIVGEGALEVVVVEALR